MVLVVQGKSSESEVGGEYFGELLRRLRALPGVERVSIANELPCSTPVTVTAEKCPCLPGTG
jgi:hypothetical protein